MWIEVRRAAIMGLLPGWDSGLKREKGAKQQDAFITLYFLIMDVMWPVTLSFRCFLHIDGLIPLNC